MNAFVPLIVQIPPSRTARVCDAPASEPAFGSVRPKAHSFSPEARGGIYSLFCSSVPKYTNGIVPRET